MSTHPFDGHQRWRRLGDQASQLSIQASDLSCQVLVAYRNGLERKLGRGDWGVDV